MACPHLSVWAAGPALLNHVLSNQARSSARRARILARRRRKISGDRRWFLPRHGNAPDGDLDPEIGGDVPHEAGPHQTCHDVCRLRLVEPERLPDLLAVNRTIEAAAAPIVNAADERAIEVLHRHAS